MRTAIITFKNTSNPVCGEYLSTLGQTLYNAGFSVDYLEVLPNSDMPAFQRALERFKDTVDNLIITDCAGCGKAIKGIIAECMNTPLSENENALRFAQAVAVVGESEENVAEAANIPIDASVIPNVMGLCQGFMLEDMDFTLIYLSGVEKEYKQACEKYVAPYLENKYGIKNRRLALKYFGSREELTNAVAESLKVTDKPFKWSISEKNGDFTLWLLFENSEENNGKEVIRRIIELLQEGIYAEFETTLAERLYDLLKLRRLKLATAESFTGGRIASAVIASPGASEVVSEGIVAYSNQSKIDRLGVRSADLIREGAVSSIVAYQMAAGLLANANTDIAISTTGIAGPNSDESGKPAGLCYIGVGMKDGVHTYKLNLTGDRERITETAKNTALFLAIKKLKRI